MYITRQGLRKKVLPLFSFQLLAFVMHLGARVIHSSLGIYQFPASFVRIVTRCYSYSVAEMSVSDILV